MTYRINIAPRAQRDIQEIHDRIGCVEAMPDRAVAWVDGLFEILASLSEFPRRCRRAPESVWVDGELRQLLYHSHRVLFTIENDVVNIVHIRHGAMLPLVPPAIRPEHSD